MKIKRNKIKNKLTKILKKRERQVMTDLVVKKTNKKTKNKKKQKGIIKWLKWLFYIFIILFFFSVGGFLIWASQLKIPVIQSESLRMSQATKIYDRTGEIVLYNIYQDEKRTVVPLSRISKNIQNATIAVEDKHFYEHSGIRPTSILSAVIDTIFYGRKRGASTITQQVIKQTILTREKTITRKVKEWILSLRLESKKEKEFGSKKHAKDSILEIYLNESPYGGTLYGVEESSLFYFGKHASDVDIAEAAYLAAMPQAPTTYSPYGKHRNVLDRRKNLVLRNMFEQGYINKNEYLNAKNEKVNFVFRKKNSGIKAPHFVMYVKDELKEMFDPERLKFGGLKVYTSLDYELQEKVQEIVKKNIDEAEEKKMKVSNGAVVVINPENGDILTMVGSKDYFAEDIKGKFNVATAMRQPGSTFKPFAYMTAFMNGYTPKTVLWDVKTEFSDACNPDYKYGSWNLEEKKTDNENLSKTKELCYHPNNFDFKFKGHILMEEALPQSRNIPAVKTLYLAGLDDTFKNIKSMGIESLVLPVNHYGLSLVLGAGEVKLLNLVGAYGVFANKGIKAKKRSIIKVTDADDNVLYDAQVEKENVIPKKISLIMSRILADNVLKRPTFGWNSPLYFTNREVASKTGTTNNNKDFWTVGFDPGHIALGVWVGNNDNTEAVGKANYYAKKIWRESMEEALRNIPIEDFEKIDEDYSDEKPSLRGIWEGNNLIKIDSKNGGFATEDTPEEFIKEIPYPEYHTILHWVDKDNPKRDVPEIKDKAYSRWEFGLDNWLFENIDIISSSFNKNIQELILNDVLNNNDNKNEVEEYSDEERKKTNLKFAILSPGEGDYFTEDDELFVNVKKQSSKIKKYEIYINDKLVGTTNRKINIQLSKINNLKNINILKIIAISNDNKINTKQIIFNIK